MFGQVLLVSLFIFPFMYVFGLIVERALFSRDMGKAGNTVKNLLFFVGVIVHEASHRSMCAMVGVPAHEFSVKYRSKYGDASPSGSINPRNPYQITLLQGFLVSFAPLLIGVWIIYFLLKVAFNPFFDLSMVKFTLQNDPSRGFYQIFLVGLSFLISWMLVGIYNIILPIEFLYYFIIIGFYIGLKYSFIGLRWCINKLRFRKGVPHSAAGYRRYARRHYKPKNPYGGQS